MKIEKKKVSSDSRWNAATKTGLAALMGLTATAAFVACDDSQSASSTDSEIPQNQEPNSSDDGNSSSEEIIDNPVSSNSSETSSSMESQAPLSSNQMIVDIPKSSSSFSEDVLSSIAEAIQSSSSEAASSSAIPASSSSEPASSSSDIQFLQPETSTSPWQQDTNSYIHMCPDGTGNCMVFSMVTTFERTDVDV